MPSLFEEFRKRHVIRVAGMYAVAGWVLIEVGMALETTLNLPAWFDTVVTVLVLIGFPIALLLAWAFDITPEGVKRTPSSSDDPGADAAVPQSGRGVDIAIIVGLIAVAGIATWQVLRKPPDATITARATIATPVAEEDQSIAVLPFVALRTNQDDAFFGKGISEELLNSLAKFPELKVAARTSAFSFAGNNIDVREVGEKLGVAHLLEGSVRRSGDKLRITAQLIRVEDGFHLWSETYDRTMTDVFEIQDEIVAELSQVLQFRLGVGAGAGRASGATTTPQAYEMYLKGLDLWWERDATITNRSEAIMTFQRVTELDPDFADGWAAYAASVALSSPSASPHLIDDERLSAVRGAFAKALALEPENVRALAGLSYWHLNDELDVAKASRSLQRAQALAPNDAFVQYMVAYQAYVVGDLATALRAIQRSVADDPLNVTKQRVGFMFAGASGIFATDSAYYRDIVEALESCAPAQSCTRREGAFAVYFLLFVATQAGSEQDVSHEHERAMRVLQSDYELVEEDRCWAEIFIEFHQRSDAPLAPSACYEKLISGAEYDEADLLSVSVVGNTGAADQALNLLFTPAMLEYGMPSTEHYFVLVDGPWEMSESIRRHPRYHEWWARPGYAELAAARRANGQAAGLPLPIAAPP